MEITLISDTHGKHNLLNDYNMGGNILIHCGDVSMGGYEYDIKDFLEWFIKQDFEYKIFVGGNHDFFLEQYSEMVDDLIEKYNNRDDSIGTIIYLENESFEYEGVKFFGTPWQPWFCDWAFNLPRGGDELKLKYDEIPDDVDVLITHSPPHKILDIVSKSYDHVGSELLMSRISKVSPLLTCFGHIHESYGQRTVNNMQFVNCSVVNEGYIVANEPVNMELNDGKILYKPTKN